MKLEEALKLCALATIQAQGDKTGKLESVKTIWHARMACTAFGSSKEFQRWAESNAAWLMDPTWTEEIESILQQLNATRFQPSSRMH